MSAVLAAGLASAGAAVITSRFGVAGTLIGAALTTMIITGGSAILSAYLRSVSGQVRRVPGKVREQASRLKPTPDQPAPNPPGRPDLRDNFMGRLRAALDWFSKLPPLRRRSILAAALVPAVIAFLIGIGAITATEIGTGKSLSCGVWNKCPTSELGNASDRTLPSIAGGRDNSDDAEVPQEVDPAQDQQVTPDPAEQPEQVVPEQPVPEQPAPEQPAPQQPATPDPATPAPATPTPENPSAEQPAPEQPPAEEPEAPAETPGESPEPAVPSNGDGQEQVPEQ